MAIPVKLSNARVFSPAVRISSHVHAFGTRTQRFNNRLQVTELKERVPSATNPLLDLQYFYGGSTALNGNIPQNNGNPTQMGIGAQAGSQYLSFTQTMGYDSLNRLQSVNDSGGWLQQFGYDRYGNAWLASSSGVPGQPLMAAQQSDYDANPNRLVGKSYDAAGNDTLIGPAQLSFDAENRIVSDFDTVAQTTVSYSYDGLGQRVTKSVAGGGSTTDVYDALGHLAAEYGNGSSSPCATCYLSQDHLGSTRMVTDQNGNVVARHDFLAFGAELPAGDGGRTSAWNVADGVRQKFTGQERDGETGLDHFPARYFTSARGRFVTPDPAGNFVADPANPQSWNMYTYSRNNPLRFVDPTGLTTCDANGNNCYDSVTVDGGSGGGVPFDCFFYSFLCGGGYQGPGLTISAPPPPPPPPPQKPPSTQPKQTFSQCMAAHANDFSIAGAVESGVNGLTGTNTRLRDNLIVGALAGNSITTLLYGSAQDNAAGQIATAPTYVAWGIGSATTYGRRTSDILSLNLAGKGGLPTALSQGAAKRVVSQAGDVLGLGLSFTQKLAIDAGFTAAEAAYCYAVTK